MFKRSLAFIVLFGSAGHNIDARNFDENSSIEDFKKQALSGISTSTQRSLGLGGTIGVIRALCESDDAGIRGRLGTSLATGLGVSLLHFLTPQGFSEKSTLFDRQMLIGAAAELVSNLAVAYVIDNYNKKK